MTAFAHLKEIKVHRGDEVREGQLIGSVRNTENVLFPELYFEVRSGGIPPDPANYKHTFSVGPIYPIRPTATPARLRRDNPLQFLVADAV